MARFFVATLNYAPEPAGFAPRVTLLAEYLAERGHTIDVFTAFPFTPQWRRLDGDRGRLFAVERRGGVTVHRVTHFIPRRPSSALQRIGMEGTFAASALLAMAWVIIRKGRPDALIYVGAQPAIALLARVVAAIVGRPYLVNITDLAAELARDVGMIRPGFHRLLDTIEFAAYGKAAGANVLCRSFADALVAHGYPASRVRVARDPIDIDLVRPVPRHPGFRAAYGIPENAFVALHAGSMGRKQGLGNLISAAALVEDPSVRWVLVGDGEARAELIDMVRADALEDRVCFVPFQREEDVSAMFAAADVLVLNQLRTVKDTVIPSKLLTYMAAGRPVVAAVNALSQGAEILQEADGGLVVPAEDPKALADAVLRCMSQPAAALAKMGDRNRAYAEAHFDRHKILAGHEAFLLDAIARARTP